MSNSLKTLETSLYWQKVVLSQSKDPKQKERAKRAINKLTDEILKIKTEV